MAVPEIYIEEFSYRLPDERIAKYPVEQRDQSKLLVWKNGTIGDDCFFNLADHLPADGLLVFNNTRVIRARLFFRKVTGALIEIFVLDPEEPADYALNFQQTRQCSWKCLVGNQKKWKSGELSMAVEINGHPVILKARSLGETDNGRIIGFSWDQPEFTFSTLLEHAGKIPIPPYLNRESEESDLVSYQTVYSKIKGSVAAPTAGLHFTNQVLKSVAEKGIQTVELTLHVGAGTFRPVKSETIDHHQMHNEQVEISRATVEHLLSHQGSLIAVGTTSVRSLESLYWLGVQFVRNPETSIGSHQVEQWEPYLQEEGIAKEKSLEAIIAYLDRHHLDRLHLSTQIIIVPGYRFRMIDGMLTNFHQPQSTLLLLVSAFIGDDWKKVYAHALETGYRFLSYGDSNLYLK